MVRPCSCTAILFFQAEDGIRDADVTGVQTCALPISERNVGDAPLLCPFHPFVGTSRATGTTREHLRHYAQWLRALAKLQRSEERRVGKEWRSRWSPYH